MICRGCGGGLAHHSVDLETDGCWCLVCRKLPVDGRCRHWDPIAPAQRFEKSARKAGRARAAIQLPREGTLKRQVYDFIASAALEGLTRAELEYKTAKTARAVGAVLLDLARDDLIEHAGYARRVDLMSEEQKAWRIKQS